MQKNYTYISDFDYVMLFSDHGCKFSSQFFYQQPHDWLNSDRTRVVMFIHTKSDDQLSFDHELRSTIDLFPTIVDYVAKERSIDQSFIMSLAGKSLYETKGHDKIVVEDYDPSAVSSVAGLHSLWAYISNHIYLVTDGNTCTFYPINSSINSKPFTHSINDLSISGSLISDLDHYTCSFSEFQRYQKHILSYQKLKLKTSIYSDNKPRLPDVFSRIYRLLYLFTKLVSKLSFFLNKN